MSQCTPLLVANESETSFIDAADPRNMVILEVGLPGDTWRYCVDREQLAKKSECFRAMLVGPLSVERSDPPPLLQLQYMEKRAFDNLFRFLHDETISFQSVTTARATIDVAHQYLCPELVQLAVQYLEKNLDASTVLEIYQDLDLYANDSIFDENTSPHIPTAPIAPEDDHGEIELAASCNKLLNQCLSVIDSIPTVILAQERFEELSAREIRKLACRDTLQLPNESVLFSALDRWTASECRKNGVEPTPRNKRIALSDDVWYSVRYLLMTDKEFIEGPMKTGILSSEESAFIIARILGHHRNIQEELQNSTNGNLPTLSNVPRITRFRVMKPNKKERQDNRKNRMKEYANQGQRACARIGRCLVCVLPYIFE